MSGLPSFMFDTSGGAKETTILDDLTLSSLHDQTQPSAS